MAPSPCLSLGWGALLPSAVKQDKSFLPLLPFSCEFEEEASALWRPWETGKTEEKKKTVGEDLNINSSECPPKPPTVPLPSPFSTPVKPAFSPFLPSLPQRRVLRRAKKRRRSPGDLVKRRQRHISYQLSQSPPSTPSNP